MFSFNFDPATCVAHPILAGDRLPAECDRGAALDAFVPGESAGEDDAAVAQSKLVVRGKYEGGAQVWECTGDLLSMLSSLPVPIRGARVLDLGCGAGLLGAAALRAGASRVVFSDLNRDVLASVTARNVAYTEEGMAGGDITVVGSRTGDAVQEPPLFIAGSWDALLAASGGDLSRVGGSAAASVSASLRDRFDVILSAETAYRPESCATLAALVDALLAPSGAAFFSTKRFYFGADLGGGTDALCAAVAKISGLSAVRFAEFTNVNVIRDIVLVRRRI
jgi:predicted nicotinamide N-methyase